MTLISSPRGSALTRANFNGTALELKKEQACMHTQTLNQTGSIFTPCWVQTRVCLCVYLDVELLGHKAGAEGQTTAVPLEEGLDVLQSLLECNLHTHQTLSDPPTRPSDPPTTPQTLPPPLRPSHLPSAPQTLPPPLSPSDPPTAPHTLRPSHHPSDPK